MDVPISLTGPAAGCCKVWENLSGREPVNTNFHSDSFQQRFILSKGELTSKQFHMLRHPKTGRPTVYAVGKNKVEELLKFDDSFRSMLLGEGVVRDGSLIILAPVNLVLLLLPYLRKYAKDDYVPLSSILMDGDFPAVKLLENVETLKHALRHSCFCKEVSGVDTFKYSEELLVIYLSDRLNRIKKEADPAYSETICAILEDSLPPDILSLLEESEDTLLNSFKKEELKRNDDKKTTGHVLRPMQTVSTSVETDARKRLRLASKGSIP